MPETKAENVIIIGSGPAGLTAAIYSSRARLEPLMIEGEEAGGQLMITTEVENYPGFEHGITGPDLITVMRQQASRFGTRFITQNVTKVDFINRPFKVYVGQTLHLTKSIIISTGAFAKRLGSGDMTDDQLRKVRMSHNTQKVVIGSFLFM